MKFEISEVQELLTEKGWLDQNEPFASAVVKPPGWDTGHFGTARVWSAFRMVGWLGGWSGGRVVGIVARWNDSGGLISFKSTWGVSGGCVLLSLPFAPGVRWHRFCPFPELVSEILSN